MRGEDVVLEDHVERCDNCAGTGNYPIKSDRICGVCHGYGERLEGGTLR